MRDIMPTTAVTVAFVRLLIRDALEAMNDTGHVLAKFSYMYVVGARH